MIRLLLMPIILLSTALSADDSVQDFKAFELNLSAISQQKIFMTQEQRLKIDRERSQYLQDNPDLFDGIATTETEFSSLKRSSSLPDKIEVNCIIIEAQGAKKVWLNGFFQNPQKKSWRLDLGRTTADAAFFWLDGKLIKVPVGSTYWVSSGRLENNLVD